MLKIDNLANLSEKELEDVVTERCATFGKIRKLKVYVPRKNPHARPFALVDMETSEQAGSLAAAHGRVPIDTSVVIFLQREKTSAYTWAQTREHGQESNDKAGLPSLMLD